MEEPRVITRTWYFKQPLLSHEVATSKRPVSHSAIQYLRGPLMRIDGVVGCYIDQYYIRLDFYDHVHTIEVLEAKILGAILGAYQNEQASLGVINSGSNILPNADGPELQLTFEPVSGTLEGQFDRDEILAWAESMGDLLGMEMVEPDPTRGRVKVTIWLSTNLFQPFNELDTKLGCAATFSGRFPLAMLELCHPDGVLDVEALPDHLIFTVEPGICNVGQLAAHTESVLREIAMLRAKHAESGKHEQYLLPHFDPDAEGPLIRRVQVQPKATP